MRLKLERRSFLFQNQSYRHLYIVRTWPSRFIQITNIVDDFFYKFYRIVYNWNARMCDWLDLSINLMNQWNSEKIYLKKKIFIRKCCTLCAAVNILNCSHHVFLLVKLKCLSKIEFFQNFVGNPFLKITLRFEVIACIISHLLYFFSTFVGFSCS